MSAIYQNFVKELAKVTAQAPKGKHPKLYNYHHFLKSPYPDVSETPENSPSHLLSKPRIQTERYHKYNPVTPANTKPTEPSDEQSPDQPQYVTDIPLPFNLLRHIHRPYRTFDSGSPVGKILGFRLEVKGRRGSRSMRQTYSYGKLGVGDIAGTELDFARSVFVNKKGASGVKVWVAYGR
ncbi:hypothetical protein HK097_000091 [Rhizophlyctis rosea]|uniref:Ribosomal protein S3 n=1 Tax=Rhizophlyctis rosea TaxID=64517 RepID=A0AAD5SI93_9FUNG|nr:hypothetical protein HK097_000091 [Rhizophlyctis rosea]